jgi:hypothetical protein
VWLLLLLCIIAHIRERGKKIPMGYETKVVFYKNRRAMQRGIKKMQGRGWEVVDTEVVERGYGCIKTGCLGCLFLPLALLGRKPEEYKVQYRRLQE